MFGNVLILGDSYSTFKDYIPEDFAIYYREDGGDTDVHSVDKTWWHQLISETNSNLVLNSSYSGSSICNTGYGGQDCSETHSFIARLNQLIRDDFFEKNEINTVFVFGGTNDYWAGSPLGEYKFSDWKKEDLYFFLPAISYLIHTLKELLPEAKIICLINTELKPEISEGIKKACEYYSIQSIQLENIDKVNGHPTIKGMAEIKNQILNNACVKEQF